MRKRFLGLSMLGALIMVVFSTSTFVAQRTRNRPAATPPVNDLKIKYRMTAGGQNMESITMIKGARERSETHTGYGMDIINLTQCDLKRTVQMSDKTRKYTVTPMVTEESPASSSGTPVPNASAPSRRGGVITYVMTSIDTGERKEMFGFQARHVKTTISMESSPDACNPVKHKMETDGWYIDFNFGLNCELGRPQMMGARPGSGGCQDRVSYRRTGTGKTGYPLIETTTSYGPNGSVTSTMTREVVELSREPLDAALFDVPAGYVETTNSQELYGMPSMESMMSQAAQGREPSGTVSSPAPSSVSKAPGAIRIGVVPINNRADRQVSTEALRARLLGQIQGNGVEAVPLNATSPADAEAEAKAKQCDFILYTDIATLKVSAAKKLGGMFGRATGIGSGGIDKTEAKVEFKLFAINETAPRLQSGASAKEEGDEASAGTAIDQEARMVSAAARKKS